MENFINRAINVLKVVLPNKSWRRYYYKLSVQLYFVNSDIKPGFIWDMGPAISINDLITLIIKLKKCNILNKYISPLCIDRDYCIINIFSLSKMTNNYFMFTDVTETLVMPKIIINRNSILKTFINMHLEQIADSLNIYHMNRLENICIPTVMGILAGYPIVYWYNNSISSNNCLSLQPLTVYRVMLKILNEDYEIFSFSVPSALKNKLENHILSWYNMLLQKNPKLKLEIFPVIRSSIVL